MARVTITIEDTEKGFSVEGDFDQPGKIFAEMTSNPTQAVAAGMAIIAALQEQATSYTGKLTDDDGSVRELSPENPLVMAQ